MQSRRRFLSSFPCVVIRKVANMLNIRSRRMVSGCFPCVALQYVRMPCSGRGDIYHYIGGLDGWKGVFYLYTIQSSTGSQRKPLRSACAGWQRGRLCFLPGPVLSPHRFLRVSPRLAGTEASLSKQALRAGRKNSQRCFVAKAETAIGITPDESAETSGVIVKLPPF